MHRGRKTGLQVQARKPRLPLHSHVCLGTHNTQGGHTCQGPYTCAHELARHVNTCVQCAHMNRCVMGVCVCLWPPLQGHAGMR